MIRKDKKSEQSPPALAGCSSTTCQAQPGQLGSASQILKKKKKNTILYSWGDVFSPRNHPLPRDRGALLWRLLAKHKFCEEYLGLVPQYCLKSILLPTNCRSHVTTNCSRTLTIKKENILCIFTAAQPGLFFFLRKKRRIRCSSLQMRRIVWKQKRDPP